MTGEKRDYEIGKTLKRKRINGGERGKRGRRERKKIRRRKKKDEVKRWEGIGQNENA
ncbi:MAG: hypothetical protein MR470_08075 [Prevotella sp.]|nr:hypothetical protein [Prevotella sp.]